MPFKTIEDEQAYRREWCRLNPDKVKAYRRKRVESGAAACDSRRYKALHPDRVKAYRRKRVESGAHARTQARYQARHPEYKSALRDRARWRQYGLTREEYSVLFDRQQGVCAICSKKFLSEGEAHVDHNHSTGVVRGILCGKCNRGLGQFNDAPETLRAAMQYLELSELLYGV